ncbi:MAG: hypothetical protein ABJN36_11725 [Cyclobacteriaceae bacterium]
MSNHTKIWNQKKSELIEKEKELRAQLEDVSNIFEGRTKTVLTISAIAGGIALLGYLGYKAFSSEEPTKTEKIKKKATKAKKKISKKAVLGTLITERLINAGLAYAGNQLNEILSGNSDKKKK